jgi:biotin carboxyl carrier protein
MKSQVRIESQVFEVEIDDLDARPIMATVDGERFEVWPEVVGAPGSTPAPSMPEVAETPARASSAAIPSTAPGPTPVTPGDQTRSVRAPIPGVIVAITAKPGTQVQIGDELCVLEAMKMRNAIRATRAGQIAEVHVTVGQHVKHQELLLEYAP